MASSRMILHDGVDAFEAYGIKKLQEGTMPTEKVCRRLEFELCKEKDHCWESDIEVNKKEVPPCKSSHRKRSIEQARAKRKRYRSNKLAMKHLKERWQNRRKIYEQREAEEKEKEEDKEETISCRLKNIEDPPSNLDEGDSQHLQEQYLEIQQEATKSEASVYTPLLLPSFIPSSEGIRVFIEGTQDKITHTVSKLSAEKYIEHLHRERDHALEQARLFRNQVDEVRSKSRQMCTKLNDRVDVVRNFWRNKIAEGSTRAGRCVRQAIKNKRNTSNAKI